MSEAIPILPMKEALKFWKKKVSIRAAEFRALQEEYRIRAFTVAKLTQIDPIDAVRKSIHRALKKGQSMGEWRAENEDIFIRAGWTGDTRYRLDTIFRTNIQAAYNAGRWKQAERGKKDRPYAMYDAINDGRARPTHLAQDGKVYPLDSAFWRTWWPPNGFRCRCSVITLSEEEVKEGKLEVRDEAAGPKGKGQKLTMKDIKLRPDDGFWANPGLHPFEVKLDNYFADLREFFLDEMRKFSPALPKNKKYLKKRDLDALETLAWVDKQGKNEDFSKWAMAVLARKKREGRGQIHPVAKIPAHVLPWLPTQPRLATVVIEDAQLWHLYRTKKVARGKAISKGEIRSIPKYFSDPKTEWLLDTKKGEEGLVIARKRKDGTWLKLVIFLDFDWKRDRKINAIRTAGVLQADDLRDARYKKIAPTTQ